MSKKTAVFVLTHPRRRDFTGFLGTYKFENGRHVMHAEADKIEKRARVLRLHYGAIPEEEARSHGAGQVHEETRDGGAEAVRPDVQSSGGEPAKVPADERGGADGGGQSPEGSVPGGNGHADAGDDGGESDEDRILAALAKLDAGNDEHWTEAGKPRIDAVEAALGRTGLKRAEIDKAAPGYTRERAAQ